jgi:hypothetical protein
VEELPDQPEQELQLPPKFLFHDLGEPVLLLTIDGHLEADMLLSVLAEHQIPAFKKSRDAGAYFPVTIGTNSLGVDVYVPPQLLNQAQKLAASIFPPEGVDDMSTATETLPEQEDYFSVNSEDTAEEALDDDDLDDDGLDDDDPDDDDSEDDAAPLRLNTGCLMPCLLFIGSMVSVVLILI